MGFLILPTDIILLRNIKKYEEHPRWEHLESFIMKSLNHIWVTERNVKYPTSISVLLMSGEETSLEEKVAPFPHGPLQREYN